MKDLKSISLGLVLLCASGLFAQTAPAPKSAAAPAAAPGWAAARKNLQTVYASFIRAASKDEQAGGEFNIQMHAILDATNQIHQAQAALIAQPGMVYRDMFAKNAVMCQRSAILFWQSAARMDRTPGHFYMPPSDDVVACSKKFAEPDPKF